MLMIQHDMPNLREKLKDFVDLTSLLGELGYQIRDATITSDATCCSSVDENQAVCIYTIHYNENRKFETDSTNTSAK